MSLALAVVHVNWDPTIGRMLLRDVCEQLKEYRLPAVQTVLREGKVAPQIVNAAAKCGAGLIAMGSRGYGRIRNSFLGNVTEEVLHKMRTPLVIAR
jgi:nucleotide-binding universal stress UspA family protein